MSACLKSRTLRVTNLHWNARAVAATIESKAAMDLPFFSGCAVICAQTSLDTIRNWEQGKRCPTGAAKALLKVLDKTPEAALAALH